ncbi:MAG: YfhO family protein [Candidatus Omnitrophica bacterium]|nr:YfhO family protein [Candidatus Omnitrophota bacterium]
MKILKGHSVFILGFSFTIILYLYPLIFMRSAFLGGDSLVQFYPWLKVYSESIKAFQFPLWSRYFHSGFPLMAEGQIGGFYPLNIIMFLTLPFKVAYNYSVILHFVLAGVFTYLFTRRLGAEEWGATLASLLFCFGSAYAGCFYNIVTLRTLAFFPLALLLIEYFLDFRKARYLIGCSIVVGMQFLAGFLQMAAYSLLFYIIYLLYGFILRRFTLRQRLSTLIIFAAIVGICALPQLILSYPLAEVSGRAESSLGFALWRSFPPPCFIGIFFPRWMGHLSAQVYISVFGILFLIYSLIYSKGSKELRPLILIGLIAILASLGRYNPLYVILLKVTGLYSFRNPSKFLFFALFAAPVLTGVGFSKFFNRPDNSMVRSASKVFALISAIALSIFFISKSLLYLFKDNIISFLQDYVSKNIVGKPYHRYDLQTYMYKVRGIYNELTGGIDLSDIFVLFSLIFVILSLAVAIMILKRPDRIKALKIPILCIIFLDIFIYSFYGTGFRGNIMPFSSLRPVDSPILNILKSDKETFRILPYDLKKKDMPDWAMPNANILHRIDSIAAYTPLVESDYRNALLPLEAVDDSLGVLSPSTEALAEKYKLLRLLNVKYIVSARELKFGFLEEVTRDKGVFLYKLKGYFPRVFFSHNISGNIRPAQYRYLEVLEYKSGLLKVKIDAPRDGFLIFSENYYPGWKVSVDGQKCKLLEADNIIQAVALEEGGHIVTFRYRPY